MRRSWLFPFLGSIVLATVLVLLSGPKPEQKTERDRIESQKRQERLSEEREDRIEAASQRQVDRSTESSDLSPYAREQLLTAQSYSKQGLSHIERAKQYYSSEDFRSVCREFGNADRAMNAATESLVPVAREVQTKQPEAMSAILRSGESLAENLESGLVLCRQLGFSWGG
jgi:hypothetical protein